MRPSLSSSLKKIGMNWPTVRIEMSPCIATRPGRRLGEARAERGERTGVRGRAGVARARGLAGGQHDQAGRALEVADGADELGRRHPGDTARRRLEEELGLALGDVPVAHEVEDVEAVAKPVDHGVEGDGVVALRLPGQDGHGDRPQARAGALDLAGDVDGREAPLLVLVVGEAARVGDDDQGAVFDLGRAPPGASRGS